MTLDSRRYHRVRRPTFTRAYGLLGAFGLGGDTGAATAGTAAAEGAGAAEAGAGAAGAATVPTAAAAAPAAAPTLASVGNFLLNRATGGIANEATSALGSLGQGLQSLFGTGSAEPAGLVGPPAPTGPGFLGGFAQGFMNAVPELKHPSTATSLGQGLGQLTDTLSRLSGQSPTPPPLPPQPILRIGQPLQPMRTVVPSMPAQVGPGPIMDLLAHL